MRAVGHGICCFINLNYLNKSVIIAAKLMNSVFVSRMKETFCINNVVFPKYEWQHCIASFASARSVFALFISWKLRAWDFVRIRVLCIAISCRLCAWLKLCVLRLHTRKGQMWHVTCAILQCEMFACGWDMLQRNGEWQILIFFVVSKRTAAICWFIPFCLVWWMEMDVDARDIFEFVALSCFLLSHISFGLNEMTICHRHTNSFRSTESEFRSSACSDEPQAVHHCICMGTNKSISQIYSAHSNSSEIVIRIQMRNVIDECASVSFASPVKSETSYANDPTHTTGLVPNERRRWSI